MLEPAGLRELQTQQMCLTARLEYKYFIHIGSSYLFGKIHLLSERNRSVHCVSVQLSGCYFHSLSSPINQRPGFIGCPSFNNLVFFFCTKLITHVISVLGLPRSEVCTKSITLQGSPIIAFGWVSEVSSALIMSQEYQPLAENNSTILKFQFTKESPD